MDSLSERLGIRIHKGFFKNYAIGKGVCKENEIILVKPLTFMNNSGVVLPPLLDKEKIELSNIVVVCDNMDLFPGVIRLKNGGGSAGHNGLRSIITVVGSGDFFRFYIGIGRPASNCDAENAIVNHVIGEEPAGGEMEKYMEGVKKAAEFIISMAEENTSADSTFSALAGKFMNEINRIKNTENN